MLVRVTGNRVRSHHATEKAGCAGLRLTKRTPGFGRGFSGLPMLIEPVQAMPHRLVADVDPLVEQQVSTVPNRQWETNYIISTRRITSGDELEVAERTNRLAPGCRSGREVKRAPFLCAVLWE